ncbi:hypothetical protein [Vreelandella titanicae]|uniref:hypothetical protein n=1 Tax=Vreelandella titanicae TaxID=664683 RepID=UPI003FD7B309
MLQLLAAIWGITLFFGGAYWLFSAAVVVFTGLEALSQPFIWLSLVGVPLALAVLQYSMHLAGGKNEKKNS